MKLNLLSIVFLFINISSLYAQEVFKVGVTIPITGLYAEVADNAKNGILLAQKEFNESQDRIKIEAIFEDIGNVETKLAATAANKLIYVDNVDIMLPLWDEDTEVILPIAEKNNLLVLSQRSGGDRFTERSDFLFRVSTSDRGLTRKALKYFKDKNIKKICFLTSQSAYFQNIKNVTIDEAKKMGFGDIKVFEQQHMSSDFRTMALKIKQYNPEGVMVQADMQGLFFKQAYEIKLNKPIVSFYLLNDPSSNQLDPKILEGIVFPNYLKASDGFSQKYIKSYNKEALDPSDYSYDSIKVLGEVLLKYGTSTEQIKKGLYEVKDYQGASGEITIDKHGSRVSKGTELLRFINGKAVPIK